MENNLYKTRDILHYKGEDINISCMILKDIKQICQHNDKNLQEKRKCNVLYDMLKNKCNEK